MRRLFSSLMRRVLPVILLSCGSVEQRLDQASSPFRVATSSVGGACRWQSEGTERGRPKRLRGGLETRWTVIGIGHGARWKRKVVMFFVYVF